MKKFLLTLLLTCGVSTGLRANEATLSAPAPATSPVTAAATQQEQQKLVNIDLTARFDWQNVSYDGHTSNSESGFRARYLAFRIDGSILPDLTYSWRQRLTRPGGDGSFLNSTDWLYLAWRTGKFTFSGGKQVLAIGGYEYDRAPVDIITASLFWNNTAGFALGVSGSYDLTKNDTFLAQISQSGFASAGQRNMYSYNLMWSGNHGLWSSLWSANMMEYAKGRFISYIALGNRFTMGPATLELDLMNRAAAHQTYLFKDCSVIADLAWDIHPRWKVFGKYSYDVNKSGSSADLSVLDGTELNMAGAGVEFYPIRHARRSLRLHADCFYAWGHNSNDADLMQSKTLMVNFGLTWDMNIFSLKRKH